MLLAVTFVACVKTEFDQPPVGGDGKDPRHFEADGLTSIALHCTSLRHRFNRAGDLLRVRGIGRVGFRRMRPYLALAGETTLASRPGRAPRARPATASN